LIYTPTRQKTKAPSQRNSAIAWHDLRNSTQLEETLQNLLEQILQNMPQLIPNLLTFTQSSFQMIQQLKQRLIEKSPQASKLEVHNIDDWHGRQCQNLWIICDQSEYKSEDNKPNVTNLKLTNLRLALTRSSDQITIFGDRQYYQDRNIWKDLISNYDFVRDIRIIETN